MFRFTIKSLMYVTALAAAWALLAREALHGPTLAALAGLSLYAGLVLWGLYNFIRAELKKSIMAGEGEREKRAE
jgi:hypothetical protein